MGGVRFFCPVRKSPALVGFHPARHGAGGTQASFRFRENSRFATMRSRIRSRRGKNATPPLRTDGLSPGAERPASFILQVEASKDPFSATPPLPGGQRECVWRASPSRGTPLGSRRREDPRFLPAGSPACRGLRDRLPRLIADRSSGEVVQRGPALPAGCPLPQDTKEPTPGCSRRGHRSASLPENLCRGPLSPRCRLPIPDGSKVVRVRPDALNAILAPCANSPRSSSG